MGGSARKSAGFGAGLCGFGAWWGRFSGAVGAVSVRKPSYYVRVAMGRASQRKVWPNVYASSITQDAYGAGDFIGASGWWIDAKRCDSWRLPTWIRNAIEKAGGRRRALIVAGDRRTLPGVFVVMPLAEALDLWAAGNVTPFDSTRLH